MDVHLLIKGAEILDGSGAPSAPGEVAIAGDRIVAVGSVEGARAKRVVSGAGLAVAPGFVDIHSHSDYHFFLAPQVESQVMQGVTCEIIGNCGYAAAPIWGPWLEDRASEYRRIHGLDLDWTTVAGYEQRLKRVGVSVNYAVLMGHGTLRGSAMGGANRPAKPEELSAMTEAARRGIREGAVGLSTGLVYAPGCFADPEEVATIARAVREEGGILTSHMRSEGDGLLEAIEEIIGIAETAQIPLQISHLKTMHPRNWGKKARMFELIESAQARGVDVTCDRYPYTAANTGLAQVMPRWALEGTKDEQVARLADPATRGRIRQEILQEASGPERWDTIMISECTLEKNQRYNGLRVSQAAALAGAEPVDFVLDLLREERNNVDAIYFSMSEDNLWDILRKPYVMIGSDAGCRDHYGPLSRGRPHPRGFGTFARVLGHYARDEKLFDLPTAVRRMTWDPCRRLGLKDRGLLRPGFAADVVLFDPARIRDTATYEDPIRYPEGVEMVLVNGVVTVEKGQHIGARAGRMVRKVQA
jgi:N-acyl-D-amino-acid deacylase